MSPYAARAHALHFPAILVQHDGAYTGFMKTRVKPNNGGPVQENPIYPPTTRMAISTSSTIFSAAPSRQVISRGQQHRGFLQRRALRRCRSGHVIWLAHWATDYRPSRRSLLIATMSNQA